MTKKRQWLVSGAFGLGIGFLAGFFGAGGGMLAVPALRRLGLDEEHAHATSISVIFPLAISSGLLYLQAGSFSFSQALVFLPGGLLGALLGAFLLPRLHAAWLHKIFAAVILFSSIRLLWK